jgi:hypothetical protein
MGESLLISQSEQFEAWQFKLGEMQQVTKWVYDRGAVVEPLDHSHALALKKKGYVQIIHVDDWLIVIKNEVVKLTNREMKMNFKEVIDYAA